MTACGGSAQYAIRARGSRKCSKHYGKEVLFVCEDCDVLVCADCVIQQHKGHNLEGVTNSIPDAKQKLQDFITRIKQIEIPEIKRKFQKVDQDLSKNKNQSQKQVSQIKKSNEFFKKELDKIAGTMVKICCDIEHHNSDIILKHQQELQTQLDKLSLKIQEVEATLQSGNDVLIYDTSQKIPSEFENLPEPSFSIAEFTSRNPRQWFLKQSFGELNITDHYQPSLSYTNQSTNWRVVSEFNEGDGYTATSLHAAGDKAWINSCKTILCVDQKGEVQQTLDMAVQVTDFCMSPQTGNIWFCSTDDRSVREVKGSEASVKFTTNSRPWSICMTGDDNVLIGYDKEIAKYTQTGQEICTISLAVRAPLHMSECPVTRNIAVAELDYGILGGVDKPFVAILNNKLQIIHTYSGEVSGKKPHPRPFFPWDVHYTNTGELVITDYKNKSVLLVTGTGKYIQTLYTNSEAGPKAACVQGGALWLTFDKGNVQVLKNN